MKNGDQLAYPVTTVEHTGFNQTGEKIYSSHTEGGLTKRELLAAMTMQGLLANSAPRSVSNQSPLSSISNDDKVRLAILIADELLQQLES